MMTIDLGRWQRIKGFMHEDEAARLYEVSCEACAIGAPILEIGSYCGKSGFIIGTACRRKGNVLFSIDHHKGSEEQQPGQAYFDPELFDERLGRVNTLPFFQQTLNRTALEDIVIPVVGSSVQIGRYWKTPLSMVFIDGGHAYETVLGDYEVWQGHIRKKGFLVFHDIFLDPQKGGQAPRKVYEQACSSDAFEVLAMTRTLGVLQKR